MHWQRKQYLQRAFGAAPAFRRLYYWLSVDLRGSRVGEPRKWCQWFREHALLIRRFTNRPALRGKVWIIDPGFTHSAILLLRLAADRVVVTSRFPWLSDRYLEPSCHKIEEGIDDFARILQLDRDTCLTRLHEGKSDLAGKSATWLDLACRQPVPRVACEDASIDDIISMGTLEHYSPDALQGAFAEMWRVLKPGGVISHIIDLRDHFHHADAALHPLSHLRHTRAEWARKTSPLSYTNQLRRSHYLTMVQNAGFRVLYAGYDPHGSFPALGDDIAAEHRTLDPIDDEARVTHIIAIKPGAA